MRRTVHAQKVLAFDEDDGVEQVVAAKKTGESLINPRPAFRGAVRPDNGRRRIFYLQDPKRVTRFEGKSYGSLREIGICAAQCGARMPRVEIEKMKELHSKHGGIYPDDVFIFLYEDIDLVRDCFRSNCNWAQKIYVHCVADEAEDITVLWPLLLSLRCEEQRLHIVRMYGGYRYEESLEAARLLWNEIKDIYVSPKEDTASCR